MIMTMRSMMIVSVLAVLCAAGVNVVPAQGQTILIDFGNASSWRGVTTPNPDGSGHYWTSVWSGAFYENLPDIDGNATTVNFGFSFAGGTDSYNGPAGVTSAPVTQAMIDAADIDAAALGSLGVNQAAMDFYTSSSFEIQGLDPAKTYNVTFFGSHKYNDNDNTTVYTVYTDSTYAAVVDSVSLLVGQDAMHNRDTVATIRDIEPQTDNILYVRFAGENGGLGYLNCLRIEEALPVKARSPEPRDGATLVPVTTNLKWTAPSGYEPVKYVLSFRADNADWNDPNNTIVVDPVVDLNLDGEAATTEAAVPMMLDYSSTYYWKVAAFKADDPNVFEGPDWSFTTEPELRVDTGPNIMTWLDGGGAIVNLNGSVDCQCVLNSVLWSVEEQPDGATAYIADDASAATWASFDTVGTYVLKLWAQDDSLPPFESEDTVEIRVFADACAAAQSNPAGYAPLAHDTNDDCRVDLADFAAMAADWLEDLSLAENLEY